LALLLTDWGWGSYYSAPTADLVLTASIITQRLPSLEKCRVYTLKPKGILRAGTLRICPMFFRNVRLLTVGMALMVP
jgi:hypothetical protein